MVQPKAMTGMTPAGPQPGSTPPTYFASNGLTNELFQPSVNQVRINRNSKDASFALPDPFIACNGAVNCPAASRLSLAGFSEA
jgi:hypothetical protein